MNTSVVIPTYNSSATIEATLASALAQTAKPCEILVLDDGSTDDTLALLERYKDRVTLLKQANRGVAQARNALAQKARGELIAFLDHDDIWHPDYLAVQQKHFADHPRAAAFFSGHDDFRGPGHYRWKSEATNGPCGVEIIAPLDFLRRYYKVPARFVSMSLCCIPKSVLARLGPEPFPPAVSGVDDYFIYHRLLLLGPFVYDARPLVAYRITPGAQSASLLKAVQKAVQAMELLEPQFDRHPDTRIRRAFRAGFSTERREYGRVLMGAGRRDEARKQFWRAAAPSRNPADLVKSLGLLFLTRVPRRFQPAWPAERKVSHSL